MSDGRLYSTLVGGEQVNEKNTFKNLMGYNRLITKCSLSMYGWSRAGNISYCMFVYIL